MMDKRIVVITGLSGSGKSCAARALEDEGFFVVDNLPLSLLPRFLEDADAGPRVEAELAVVVDVRNRQFLAEAEKIFAQVRASGFELDIVFFDASDEVLIRRFSETRRRHPLTKTEQVADGIARERVLLGALKNNATRIVDTSWLTPHQLRQQVITWFRGEQKQLPLAVMLQSFGFRYGLPAGSDLVLDVRFLPNPHFIPELQPMTGTDEPVQQFVLDNPICRTFLDRLGALLEFLLPQYRQEGKSYLSIAVGCTGGRHRSVAVVERLRQILPSAGVSLEVTHRDILKR
jgi:RNase adapter protein RapZ